MLPQRSVYIIVTHSAPAETLQDVAQSEIFAKFWQELVRDYVCHIYQSTRRAAFLPPLCTLVCTYQRGDQNSAWYSADMKTCRGGRTNGSWVICLFPPSCIAVTPCSLHWHKTFFRMVGWAVLIANDGVIAWHAWDDSPVRPKTVKCRLDFARRLIITCVGLPIRVRLGPGLYRALKAKAHMGTNASINFIHSAG